MLTPSYFSLTFSLSISTNHAKIPLLQTSSRRRALLDPQLSVAKSLSLSNAPAILRPWPWTPITTRSCSERTGRGARTIIGEDSVSRKKVLSSWTASTPVESYWQGPNYKLFYLQMFTNWWVKVNFGLQLSN